MEREFRPRVGRPDIPWLTPAYLARVRRWTGGWRARKPVETASANTIADGLATRSTYEMTFPTLLDGLADFITVTDPEIADAMRMLLRTTHTLIEPAGAAGLAGLRTLAPKLEGKRVGIVLSGANVDSTTLQRVLSGEL